MKEKHYSVSEIQKIIDLSPNELLKLIRKHSSKIKIFKIRHENGTKESFIDKESLKKIIFLRQLESGFKLNLEEVCELLDEQGPDKSKVQEFFEKTNFSDAFSKKFDEVEKEVIHLRAQLSQMITRYDYCLKQLSLNKAKNIALTQDIKRLKNREAALIDQFNRNSRDNPEEIPRKDLN
jgi:hypothetical protein